MSALVCDICDGSLMISSGGVATCSECGMTYTKERMQEKIRETKQITAVDHDTTVMNYYKLAENAYESDNKAETETYCNKIIELMPKHSEAWLLKGKAAGWQSTLANSRLNEAVNCFAKAIEYSELANLETIKAVAASELKELAVALMELRGRHFAKFPDQEETNGFTFDLVTILKAVNLFMDKCEVLVPGIMNELSTVINQAVVNAWGNRISPDYQGDEGKPSEYEWRTFIDRIGYCVTLVEKAIDLNAEEDEANIQLYENLIFLHKEANKSCSWDYEFTDWGKKWHQEYILSDNAKSIRRQMITDYEQKAKRLKDAKQAEIDKRQKEEADQRFKAYWDAHTEEKKTLEAEQQSLHEELNGLKKQKNEMSERQERESLQSQLTRLQTEKVGLGLFKFNEKNELKKQIETLATELTKLEATLATKTTELDQAINLVQARLNKLHRELTQPR